MSSTNRHRQIRPFSILVSVLLFCLGFLIGGSACCYSGIINGPTCNPSCWLWPTAYGTVISSGLHTSQGTYVWAQYTYTVNRKRYSPIGPEGCDSSSLNWQSNAKVDGNSLVVRVPDNTTVDKNLPLPAGMIIRVHYNPEKPDESIWDSGFNPTRTFIALLLSMIPLMLGAAYLLYGLGILGRKKQLE